MSESAETGQPGPATRKNRKINRSAGQLKRNAACVPCRRRRVKCDGTKPICSSCTRSFQFLARTQPDPERDEKRVQCWYEEGEDGDYEHAHEGYDQPVVTATAGQRQLPGHAQVHGHKRKAEQDLEVDSRTTIRHLELQVAELQNALRAATDGSSRPSSARPTRYHTPAVAGWTPEGAPLGGPIPAASHPGSIIGQSYPWPPTQYDESTNALVPPVQTPQYTPVPPVRVSPPARIETMPENPEEERMDAGAGQIGGPFVDVFWPGWPKRLPTPTMMDHLVFTFFSFLPAFGRLIHRQAFLTRLALPPRHPDFPHPALLHAICASAARYSAAVKVCSVQQLVDQSLSNPPPELAPGQTSMIEEAFNEPCFAERHWKYCNMEIRYDNCKGTKLLDVLLAQTIICQYLNQTAKWLDGWVIVGSMTRTAIALGLMDEAAPGSAESSASSGMLPPPRNDWEREERRAIVSELVACDLQYSASGSWPGTLPAYEEMHFRLPASKAHFMGSDPIPENPQTVNSPNLFTHHPVEDAFVMYIKASLLIGRVSKFSRKLRHMSTADKLQAQQSPDFLAIDRDLSDFNRTFPPTLRDPVQSCPGYANRIDTDLVNAHLIRRVASILLHISFADINDPTCASAGRILVEARACLGVLYLVMSTTADMALMLYPVTSVWLYHPARTLLMFYHRSLELGDQVSSKTLLGEIEVFQMAFAVLGNRFAMGAVHCGMVDTMVRKIHQDFGLPEQSWRWSPRDWAGGLQDSSALNYQAGMRSRNPRLPLLPNTHPDGKAWAGESKNRKSYREIIDQQRNYVGPPRSASRMAPTVELTDLAGLAGLAAASAASVQSTAQMAPAGMSVTMGPVPHLYDTYSYPVASTGGAGIGMQGRQ